MTLKEIRELALAALPAEEREALAKQNKTKAAAGARRKSYSDGRNSNAEKRRRLGRHIDKALKLALALHDQRIVDGIGRLPEEIRPDPTKITRRRLGGGSRAMNRERLRGHFHDALRLAQSLGLDMAIINAIRDLLEQI